MGYLANFGGTLWRGSRGALHNKCLLHKKSHRCTKSHSTALLDNLRGCPLIQFLWRSSSSPPADARPEQKYPDRPKDRRPSGSPEKVKNSICETNLRERW